MANSNIATIRPSDERAREEQRNHAVLIYECAASAMSVYAVANMLSQHIEDVEEPGPACALIAEQASQLNNRLREIAQRIDGRLPGEYMSSEHNRRFASLLCDLEQGISERLDDLDYAQLPVTDCDDLLARFTNLHDLLADTVRKQGAAYSGRKGEPRTPPELIESAEAMLVNTLDALDYDNMDRAEANRVTAAIMAAENAIARREA